MLSVCCICLFVCPFEGQILLPRYLINGLSSFDQTYREYSPAPSDDLIRFWRSKVKVTAGRRGAKASALIWKGCSAVAVVSEEEEKDWGQAQDSRRMSGSNSLVEN